MTVLADADRVLLACALDRRGMVAASLIGSQARGTASTASDVALAVWLAADLDERGRAALRDELAAAATEALGRDDIDVVLLDDASPLVRHRAMRDGVRLVDRDRDERVRRETASLLEYLDTAPLRELRSRSLDHLLGTLEAPRAAGLDVYLADEQRRLAAERALTVALRVCIDVAAQIVSERDGRTPDTYAGVFSALAAGEGLDPGLADRLGAAARQRNLLVHLYLEIDDRRVFATLEHLDDLRAFAAYANAQP